MLKFKNGFTLIVTMLMEVVRAEHHHLSKKLDYAQAFEMTENDPSATFERNYNAFDKLHFLLQDHHTCGISLEKINE
jgi:hypothetical protein